VKSYEVQASTTIAFDPRSGDRNDSWSTELEGTALVLALEHGDYLKRIANALGATKLTEAFQHA
jgi:hypothetical protein